MRFKGILIDGCHLQGLEAKPLYLIIYVRYRGFAVILYPGIGIYCGVYDSESRGAGQLSSPVSSIDSSVVSGTHKGLEAAPLYIIQIPLTRRNSCTVNALFKNTNRAMSKV